MNIPIDKTLRQIARCLDTDRCVEMGQLRKAYELTLKLQSQLLGVIYDMETFTPGSTKTQIASNHSHGETAEKLLL